MKKSILSLALAASLAFSVNAQERAVGSAADDEAAGYINAKVVTAGVVTVAFALAVSSNSNGTSPTPPPPPPPPPAEPECDAGDPLIDGVCVGTTTTNTVTLSGTTTINVEVPTTFTYLPTIRG